MRKLHKNIFCFILSAFLAVQIMSVSFYTFAVDDPALSDEGDETFAPDESDDSFTDDDLIDTDIPDESDVPDETAPPETTSPPATTTPSGGDQTGAETPVNQTLYCTTGTLNMRAAPSASATLLGTLKMGDKIYATSKLTANGYTWYKFTAGSTTAYAVSTYFSSNPPTSETTAPDVTRPETSPEETDEPIGGGNIEPEQTTLPPTTEETESSTKEDKDETEKDEQAGSNDKAILIASIGAGIVLIGGIAVPILAKYYKHKKIYQY